MNCCIFPNPIVMPGLDPGIHDFLRSSWMAGLNPAMTS